MVTEIRNGRILYPDGTLAVGSLCFEEDYIKGFDTRGGRTIDAEGKLVLPGIIDIHGDAFERILLPRPEAVLPPEMAFAEADRQLLANGITTAYFGISITWEYFKKLRNDREARALLERFHLIKRRLRCDARSHLRFEIYHAEAVAWICDALERGIIDLISFNDHLSYIDSELKKPDKLLRFMSQTGLTESATIKLYQDMGGRKEEALKGVETIAAQAVRSRVPMASHDEEEPAVRQWYHDLGCRICEFPCNEATAAAAVDLGDPVVLGAPNAIKGTSLYNRLSSREAIKQGLCQILASDYYYPSILQAAFLCERTGICDLPEAWRLVSQAPARACGLIDRGWLEPGLQADIVLVDDTDSELPEVAATFAQGKLRYANVRLVETALPAPLLY
jgi:alpha-D-ribose 1-methylphosphonate 5-triphosphate diphosphatase